MKMLSKKIIAGAALVIASLSAGSALAAGSLQGQMNVQITVGSGCTVTNGTNDGSNNAFGNLTFGSYADLANIVNGRSVGSGGGSSFGVKCSQGTAYSVALDSGQNASGNQRRMQHNGEFVNYDLYQDTSRSQAWGNGSNGGTTLAGVGTGNNSELVVYGRVPAQTTPSPGTYLDTVQVTVAW